MGTRFWDQALDLVQSQLKRVREKHGPTGILLVLMAVGLAVVHYMLLVHCYVVI